MQIHLTADEIGMLVDALSFALDEHSYLREAGKHGACTVSEEEANEWQAAADLHDRLAAFIDVVPYCRD